MTEKEDFLHTGHHDGRCMSSRALDALNELRQNQLLCDATIHLDDGGVFPVHRAILSSCSSYFRAMFTTTLNSTNKSDVRIANVSSDIMSKLLEYAYLRTLELDEDNVFSLLVTADYLCIVGVITLCCDFLESSLRPDNCIGIMFFARNHFCAFLEKCAWLYIMRNFTQIVEVSMEILELPAKGLMAIIESDMLNVRGEEIVWNTVLRWVDHNPNARKSCIFQLMEKIRLGLMETQFFLEKVKDHPYVSQNRQCRPLIIETLRFLYDLEMITEKKKAMVTPMLARPRMPHEILFAIGGWSGGSPTSYIETYDTRADRWVKVHEVDPLGPRAYHGTAVIDFKIYVIGGFDGVDYFNSCRCFDAVEKTWSEVAPMNGKRCYVSVAVLGTIIYAMGGYDGHHRQNTAEKYNYKTNQWTVIASMRVQRSDASSTTLNDKVYITGGFNGQECMNSAEVYDPAVNQWTLITPMRSRRSGVSCIAYHGYIYVLGGFNGISRMCSGEKFDPATNVWSVLPDMYNPRSNFGVEVIDDMVFAIGGFNGVTTVYHVECYDDKTNEWYEATNMNLYRSALSACIIMGLPNTRDYIHQQRESLMEDKRQRLLAHAAERQRTTNTTNTNRPLQNVQLNEFLQDPHRIIRNFRRLYINQVRELSPGRQQPALGEEEQFWLADDEDDEEDDDDEEEEDEVQEGVVDFDV